MQFYFAVNDDGKTLICGTQAEAGLISKAFRPVDIPVDKTGLKGWIQQMLDETLNAEPIETQVGVAPDGDLKPEATNSDLPAPAEPPKPEPVKFAPPVLPSPDNIVEWVLFTAEQRQIERLYEALGCRVGEIIRADRKKDEPA